MQQSSMEVCIGRRFHIGAVFLTCMPWTDVPLPSHPAPLQSSHSVVLSTSRDVRIYDAMQGRLLKVHPQPDS